VLHNEVWTRHIKDKIPEASERRPSPVKEEKDTPFLVLVGGMLPFDGARTMELCPRMLSCDGTRTWNWSTDAEL
jgi:hypothetical protein